ncbi:MAG: DsbA family oxidoreductase [Chloracidobacterium sp.]|nr:DsbA family oxidoreductase [Chloracidobacterium sp.]MCC6826331.1 DsbA family oxidoreductase [Acidobacteriota bacterium]MCO5333079.1 DsbA family oxidoreductase [Pyrinomonadaceae bacterium]
MSDLTEKLRVEVWSDVVCPFCYIGKRNYEAALAKFEHPEEVVLEFRAFQLDPNMTQDPNKKTDLREHLAHKYGRSLPEADAMLQQMAGTAKNAGLTFNFDTAVRFNTYQAHRIAQIAKEKGLGNEFEEALFAAYFTNGIDLGSAEKLRQVAASVGLCDADLEAALNDETYAAMVDQDLREAASIGISGVPFFLFNKKYAVSGAQPPEVFLEALNAAYNDWKRSEAPEIKAVSAGSSCDIGGNCDR